MRIRIQKLWFAGHLSYEVVTGIKVFNEIPAKFPAVTFYLLRNNKANLSLDKILVGCNFTHIYTYVYAYIIHIEI